MGLCIQVEGSEETKISDVMVRRVQLMAEFIKIHAPEAFAEYWTEHYLSQAKPLETIEFFAQENLSRLIVMHRKVKV